MMEEQTDPLALDGVVARPLELPVWEPTGEGRVDAALDRIHELDELPTSEHVAVFEDIHRRLQEALADVTHAD